MGEAGVGVGPAVAARVAPAARGVLGAPEGRMSETGGKGMRASQLCRLPARGSDPHRGTAFPPVTSSRPAVGGGRFTPGNSFGLGTRVQRPRGVEQRGLPLTPDPTLLQPQARHSKSS